MSVRDLEGAINRKGRQVATVNFTADPADTTALARFLTDWLAGDGWDQSLWGQFEMKVFARGTWTRLATVRA